MRTASAAFPVLEGGEAGAVVRVHRELRRVQLRRPERDLPIELGARFRTSPRARRTRPSSQCSPFAG